MLLLLFFIVLVIVRVVLVVVVVVVVVVAVVAVAVIQSLRAFRRAVSSGALGLSVVVFPSLLAHVLCLLMSFDSLGLFLLLGLLQGSSGFLGLLFGGSGGS